MSIKHPETQVVESDLEAISRALRGARLAKTALAGFPGPLPKTLDAAYQIQSLSIQEWPDQIAGWKVGGVPERFQGRFKAERLAGPIFSRQVIRAPAAKPVQMPAFRHGFAAVEPEFIFELGDVTQIDPETATLESLAAGVNRCFVGVEVASSPVPDINAYGPTAVVSDFGNNFGLVVGQEIAAWDSTSLAQITVSTIIDGTNVGECCGQSGFDGPLGAVRFLIQQLCTTGQALPAGLLISTGAITGVHEASIGTRTRVSFAGHGVIELELVDIE